MDGHSFKLQVPDDVSGWELGSLSRAIVGQAKRQRLIAKTSTEDKIMTVTLFGGMDRAAAFEAAVKHWVGRHDEGNG